MSATIPTLDPDRQQLALAWVRLAKKLAWEAWRRYRGAIPVDDLIADAYVGLCRAAAGFDPWRGLSFATYAVPAIRRAIQRGSAEHFAYQKHMRRFAADAEAAFDAEAAVPDHRENDPGAAEEHRQQLAEARRRLEVCLRDRERTIVVLHFLEGQTHEAIGQRLGLTGNYVCLVCGVAVQRLRDNEPLPVDPVELGPQAWLALQLGERKIPPEEARGA